MNVKKGSNRLEQIAGNVSLALGAQEGGGEESAYEFSTAYRGMRPADLLGEWEVVGHTWNGSPWSDVFAQSAFKDMEAPKLDYDAMYSFSVGNCVKRIRLTGSPIFPGADAPCAWEYRMTTALTWELKNDELIAKPLIGYQYTAIDGAPSQVRELPGEGASMTLKIRMDDGELVIEDGSDIKRLRKAAHEQKN
ncbi:MAG TPA: hypothetical protein PL077_00640 [Treponemataceae bacterium]|nr:hypothetical protein [Treponemataceae bacterium]